MAMLRTCLSITLSVERDVNTNFDVKWKLVLRLLVQYYKRTSVYRHTECPIYSLLHKYSECCRLINLLNLLAILPQPTLTKLVPSSIAFEKKPNIILEDEQLI